MALQQAQDHSQDYNAFLAGKRLSIPSSGFHVDPESLHPGLRDEQKAVVSWALAKGKAAIFGDTGLGKTAMELQWADQVYRHTGGKVLILAPLAVAQQTVREGREKWGVEVTIGRNAPRSEVSIHIANYEQLHHYRPEDWTGIVLDESSILKGYDGKTRQALTAFAQAIPYRLPATATPAPNDLLEITNHAEFLGVMGGKEIIALFFKQDGNTTHSWRLKGHAERDFWRWMAGWCRAYRRPSDLGPFSDEGFDLPELRMHSDVVEIETAKPGSLFALEAVTMEERRAARRESIAERVARVAEIANGTDEPVLVWCDLNAESAALAKAIRGAVEVKGSDKPEHKERAMLGFSDGSVRVLVSKPSICGFGMNWQHCNLMAFTGLSDSFEQQYQAIRRCWRFGQTRPVDVHIVTASTEGNVVRNIERKKAEHERFYAKTVRHMSEFQTEATARGEMEYCPSLPMVLPDWLQEAA